MDMWLVVVMGREVSTLETSSSELSEDGEDKMLCRRACTRNERIGEVIGGNF
jgi:hypothetical protein